MLEDEFIKEVEDQMRMVIRRMEARRDLDPSSQSHSIDLGDRCYLHGLGFALGRVTLEQKETIVSRLTREVQETKPRTKAKVVRRRSTTAAPKRKIVRRKK